MKVTISYKLFGAIETDLDVPEGQDFEVEKIAHEYLCGLSDKVLVENLDRDADMIVATDVSTDEVTLYPKGPKERTRKPISNCTVSRAVHNKE